MVFQDIFFVTTRGRGTSLITGAIQERVRRSGISTGICNIFLHHTSASLILCENADPDVRSDLERYMAGLVPDGDPGFEHVAEGPDDMPAHIKGALTQTALTIPITGGAMALGTWQGIFLFEHRSRPHERGIVLHAIGV